MTPTTCSNVRNNAVELPVSDQRRKKARCIVLEKLDDDSSFPEDDDDTLSTASSTEHSISSSFVGYDFGCLSIAVNADDCRARVNSYLLSASCHIGAKEDWLLPSW